MSTRVPGLVRLPLRSIEPNPFNVRGDLSPAALRGLVQSIREQGLIHPILVRPHPDPERFGQYQIVCGERRFHAYGLLAADDAEAYGEVPARVEALDDTAALAAILQENELRADWTPYEKAAFFHAVYNDGHFASIRRMADAMGLGLTTLHRYLRIFDLPAAIVERFRRGELGLALVEVVLEADPAVQLELAAILAERPVPKPTARRLARQLSDPGARDWVDDLVARWDSAPAIQARADRDEGLKLTIAAHSPGELRGLLEALLRDAEAVAE